MIQRNTTESAREALTLLELRIQGRTTDPLICLECPLPECRETDPRCRLAVCLLGTSTRQMIAEKERRKAG